MIYACESMHAEQLHYTTIASLQDNREGRWRRLHCWWSERQRLQGRVYLIYALRGKHRGKVVLVAEAAPPGIAVVIPRVHAVLLKHLRRQSTFIPLSW